MPLCSLNLGHRSTPRNRSVLALRNVLRRLDVRTFGRYSCLTMKRATIYIEEDLHKALKIKAFQADQSISDLVNDAVRVALDEDLEDLTDAAARKHEQPIAYEAFLQELKSRGQI